VTDTGANSYVLNLGTLLQGASVSAVTLEALNAATGLADQLDASTSITGSSAFTNTGFANFTNLTAGSADALGSITVSTANTGTLSETITLTPTDVNSDAFSKVQTPITLMVNAVVIGNGTASGDVHLVTFDGLHYDFQADGDYVLTRSTVAGNPFQIQIHTDAYPLNDLASVITQAAADVGGNDVQFNLNGSVAINGVTDSVLSPGAVQAMSGGTLTALGNDSYSLVWSTGETLTVTNAGLCLNLSTTVGPNDGPGSVQGLLGSLTGQAHDLQLADGTVLPIPSDDSVLLGAYASSWAVTAAQSLLGSSMTVPVQAADLRLPPAMTLLQAIGPSQILTGSQGLANQAVTISGSLATLAGDTVVNLGSADLIDFTNLGVAAATTWTAATGLLTVSDGTQSTSLHLLVPSAAASVHVVSDQHGGTLVGIF
jgi:hypothetical protein